MSHRNIFMADDPDRRLRTNVQSMLAAMEAVVEGLPSDHALIFAPRLTDWQFVVAYGELSLLGQVRGHPRLREDRIVVTSRLLYVDTEHGIARTRSRWYRIGMRRGGGGGRAKGGLHSVRQTYWDETAIAAAAVKAFLDGWPGAFREVVRQVERPDLMARVEAVVAGWPGSTVRQ